MTRRAPKVLLPPTTATRTTVTTRSKHSTVPRGALDVIGKPPRPARLPAPPPKPKLPKKPRVAHIVGDDEESLLDLIDNLLAKGVVLNADLILALANVDLVYVRLSALLCAADRVLGPISPKPRSGERGPVPPKPRSGEGG
jgi:hypothetical protein